MAGSKKDTFETSVLNHIFCNAAMTGIGDAGGLLASSTAGSLYIALYVDGTEPSDSASGTETTYTNYARVAVARSAGGWTVAAGACSNTAAITFAQCGASGATLGAFAICKAGTTGVDDQLYWGELTSPLAVSSGITPEFAIGDLDVTED
jgi:hypothetical protein